MRPRPLSMLDVNCETLPPCRRHVAFVMVGVNVLIGVNFPFNPPFPTIGERAARHGLA